MKMLTYRKGSPHAVIVLHEIYGINRHIRSVCRQYHRSGYDVYCPNLLPIDKPFPYREQQKAYKTFFEGGWDRPKTLITDLCRQVRKEYDKVIVIGFCVGATLAWMMTPTGLCDGVVAYYGSRIRDLLEIQPCCPSLLIFAEHEASFDPNQIIRPLRDKPFTSIAILKDSSHGFMDRFGGHYDAAAFSEATSRTQAFLQSILLP